MQHDFQELTLKIYDTVADTSLWPDVLDRFVATVGAQGCIVFEWERMDDDKVLRTPYFSGFYQRKALDLYLKRYAYLEARDQETLQKYTGDSDGIDVIDDTVFNKTADELRRDEHVRRLKNFGIFRRAAGVLNKDNRSIALFSVQLADDGSPLNNRQRQVMAQCLPHFAKALDLGMPVRQLHSLNQGMLNALDRLTVGVCLVDPNGYVVVRNAEFMRQQDEYRAFKVSDNGILRINDTQGHRQFEALKAGGSNHGKFGARPRKEALGNTTDGFLCIEVTPLHRSDEIGSKAFDGYLVCSTDTSRPVDCEITPMQEAFGLTATEMALVKAIGEGLTNPEIAERRERATTTVNSQVKSILAKTQCTNRTQLVRMMSRFGGNFLRPPG